MYFINKLYIVYYFQCSKEWILGFSIYHNLPFKRPWAPKFALMIVKGVGAWETLLIRRKTEIWTKLGNGPLKKGGCLVKLMRLVIQQLYGYGQDNAYELQLKIMNSISSILCE